LLDYQGKRINVALRFTRSVIPNLFTLANLFCGFSAIIRYAENDYIKGTMLLFAAALFDMLDGVMARLTKSASELGVELDSLCDAVSFGIAPSFLLYQVYYRFHPTTGILLASLPAMAGVYRLARFNAQITSLEDKEYFRGMPIPAGAMMILSYVMFVLNVGKGSIDPQLPFGDIDAWTIGVTIVVSLAMVSTIRYENLPRPSRRSMKSHPILFVAGVTGTVLAIITEGQSLFPFLALYVVVGFVRHIWTGFRTPSVLDDELENPDEDDGIFYPSQD
jgi:CDP-diacylglycerol--serine O-phosphatidyltransferase